jgi:hypothetical protein
MQGCGYASPLFPDLQPHPIKLAVASIAVSGLSLLERMLRGIIQSQMTLFLDLSCDSIQQTRLGQRRVVRQGGNAASTQREPGWLCYSGGFPLPTLARLGVDAAVRYRRISGPTNSDAKHPVSYPPAHRLWLREDPSTTLRPATLPMSKRRNQCHDSSLDLAPLLCSRN